MSRIMLFGQPVEVVEKESAGEPVEFKDGKIIVRSAAARSKPLKEFLADQLYTKLCSVYDEIKESGKVELFGNIDFVVMEKIDGRWDRVAKLKGNKVLVKLAVVTLPRDALKYVLAHELAHVSAKRHTPKFWKVVETIYPGYEAGEESFATRKQFLQSWTAPEWN